MNSANRKQRILICGAGIAGLTLAHELSKFGFKVYLIEKSTSLRNKGNMIAFFSSGVEVAKRMGIFNELSTINHQITRMIQFNMLGHKTLDLDISGFIQSLDGLFFNFLRSDLVDLLHELTKNIIPIHFNTSVIDIDKNENGYVVRFSNFQEKPFDLIICAEGVNSRLRRMVFPKCEIQLNHLNYYASSFNHSLQLNAATHEVLCFQDKGKLLMTYCHQGINTSLAFFKKEQNITSRLTNLEKKAFLHRAFSGFGEPLDNIFNAINTQKDIYLGEEKQVKLKSWHKDRICFIGDAAHCTSLVSGQGASLAITGAYLLASKLHKYKFRYTEAFKEYETEFRPITEQVQTRAIKNLGLYIPDKPYLLWFRNKVSPLLFSRLCSPLLKKMISSNKALKLK